ncbi:tRNA(Ile)(2)-agmatinylcytidine synthase [Candidatus Bathyarchaeota archaeon]|nr:tRNA(Ile)(2)-agmatinylcytidine synthase [Candidatus Bathyarchaeota archaeon]
MQLHVGIDDTDSPSGGCTTYVAALLVERLLGLGARFTDYPNLLRLNPNAPWKTRGNASICLRFELPEGIEEEVKRAVVDTVDSQGEFDCENTNPGIVFHVGGIPEVLRGFSERVVQGIVALDEAEALIEKHCAGAVGYKNRRGLIGALAAVGGLQDGDHTYEVLTYRVLEYRGKPRMIDAASVKEMDEASRDSTFNNLDPETGQVLIAPHGPDPILYGVRGEAPEEVHRAMGMISVEEPVERWVIFRTNQGTDAHLKGGSCVAGLKPRNPAVVEGKVSKMPRTITGGHVIFTVNDGTGDVDCAAYEPTGGFREVALRLREGDRVRVAGGVRQVEEGLTLNLERVEVLDLAEQFVMVNPRCPACGSATESMGRGQGFRCKKCGLRDPKLSKKRLQVGRELEVGLYMPPPRAHRHLTKPLSRYGKEKKDRLTQMFEPWHLP